MASSRGVTLIGAGTQGTRLAYMVRPLLSVWSSSLLFWLTSNVQWSRCGRPVHLVDKNPEQLDRAANEIQRLRKAWPLASLPGDRGGNTNWGTATFTPPEKLEAAVQQSWLAIECVPESRPLKKAVIQQLDGLAPPDVIVASNSSSYTITEILEGLSPQAPDRFASIHSCMWIRDCSSHSLSHSNSIRLATRNNT